MHDHQDIRYVVISFEEVNLLDFSDFFETSMETLAYNPDQTQSVVKYIHHTPYVFRYPTYGPFTLDELYVWKENNGWPFVDDIDFPIDK
jgi:hypothetical protein